MSARCVVDAVLAAALGAPLKSAELANKPGMIEQLQAQERSAKAARCKRFAVGIVGGPR